VVCDELCVEVSECREGGWGGGASWGEGGWWRLRGGGGWGRRGGRGARGGWCCEEEVG
jgi:hypothetical protein